MKPWKPNPEDSKLQIHVRAGDQVSRLSRKHPMGGAHTQSRMAVISFLKSTPSRHAATLGLPCTPGPFSRELVSWFPPSLAEAQVSSLGATLGTGRQGWVPKAERSNLPEELVFPEVKESQRVRSQPVGYRGRKTPTPRSTPQAPTLLYLFIYLGKGPKAQAGNGPIPAGRAGGTRSHIVFPARLPHPGPATGA